MCLWKQESNVWCTLVQSQQGVLCFFHLLKHVCLNCFGFSPENFGETGIFLQSRGLLDILSSSSEFNNLPVRQQEEKALKMLTNHLPQKVGAEADVLTLSDTCAVLFFCFWFWIFIFKRQKMFNSPVFHPTRLMLQQ